MPIKRRAWHAESTQAFSDHHAVIPEQGLSEVQVAGRLAQFGRNELPEGVRRGPLTMFLGQCADFMIIVLLNAIIGFIQESRAERAIAALKRMAAPAARVRREGVWREIDAAELVPGDVVELEAGSVVPADLRILEVARLRQEEAALTGKSQPVDK